MLDRRAFLRSSAVAALGGAGSDPAVPRPAPPAPGPLPPGHPELAAYERALAGSPELELLGIQRSWSVVREGFPPFSPERVLVLLGHRSGFYSAYRHAAIRHQVETKFARRQEKLRYHCAKFRLLLAILEFLVAYYQVPDYFEDWAFRLAVREQLGATGLGQGFGWVHQFQRKEEQIVATVVHPPVDWWLFLIPAGVDYKSLDAQPVCALIGPVTSRLDSCLELGIMELATKLARHVTFGANGPDPGRGWRAIARRDRLSAARFLNQAIAHCLQGRAHQR
jgi:hypothetical protein